VQGLGEGSYLSQKSVEKIALRGGKRGGTGIYLIRKEEEENQGCINSWKRSSSAERRESKQENEDLKLSARIRGGGRVDALEDGREGEISFALSSQGIEEEAIHPLFTEQKGKEVASKKWDGA